MNAAEIIYGLTLGFLAGFFLLYTFKPNEPYPRFIIDLFQYPWVFIFILIAIIYIFYKDIRIGVMLSLIVTMILLDSYFLGRDVL